LGSLKFPAKYPFLAFLFKGFTGKWQWRDFFVFAFEQVTQIGPWLKPAHHQQNPCLSGTLKQSQPGGINNASSRYCREPLSVSTFDRAT